MDLHTSSERTNPRFLELMRLHKCWAWFLILGIARGVAFRDLGRQAVGSVRPPTPCRPGIRRPRT